MSQPVSAATARKRHSKKTCPVRRLPTAIALPDERAGITHHFSIAGHEGYLNRRSLSEWAAG